MIEAASLLLVATLAWLGLMSVARAVRGPAAGTRRILRALTLGAVALAGTAAAAHLVTRARGFQLFGEIVARVETDARVVALTFDDGPSAEYTDDVLDVLRAEGVRATFFLNGASIASQPGAAARIADAGHEIGNHTWSHPLLLGRSAAFVRDQVGRTDTAIRGIGYDGPIHFRPPYGRKLIVLPWVLARAGRTSVTWDVAPDGDTAVAASADGIVAHVREHVRPGSILLLHVMYPDRATSREAVPGIIRALRADGYSFVTVSQLLEPGRRH